MLRVRDGSTREVSRAQFSMPETAATPVVPLNTRSLKLAAMAMLGLSLGAGGAVFTVSLVQAQDDAGVRAFHQQEAASRQASRPARPAAHAATAYAPARNGWTLPLMRTLPDGRIAHPPVEINPFRKREVAAAQKRRSATARLDTVSGAANVARTICVRLCDGFHAPIGYLRSPADIKGHEALCQAMNPGIPVKVYRVAAGAETIEGAQAADGKRYSALPMAYSHEKASDAACRPAIVQAGERRISLLRDFTLRPGDSVVLDGKVRTFVGGSRWPYSTRDFRDFRSTAELSKSQRRQIDERVGVSRMEAQARGMKRQLRLREASLQDDDIASDATWTVALRGGFDAGARGTVRMIAIDRPQERR
jgi:hypothetical protein